MSNNNQLTESFENNVLPEAGEMLYLNDDLADFYFIFELSDGQCDRIPAHKFPLGGGSKVFRTMFNGSWLEKHEVKMVDASAAEFKEFLQFFYLRRVKLSMENVEKVMYLGNKYDVESCLNACSEYLTQRITAKNVCWAYGLASIFGQKKLEKYCEIIIALQTKALLSSGSFLECDQLVLSRIMKMDSLSCSETELFNSCMAWVRNVSREENLTREIVDAHLGKAFFEIRYRSMTMEEFALLITSFGCLFSAEDYQEIIHLIVTKDFKPEKFNPNARIKFIEILSENSVSEVYDRAITNEYSTTPYIIKNIEITKLTCNKPFLLSALKCTKIKMYKDESYYELPEGLETKITITQISVSGERNVIINHKIMLKSDKVTVATFSKPVLIMVGFMYEIKFEQNPPDDCCTGIQLKSEIEIDSDMIVQFHDNPKVEGDKTARGIVRVLTIHRI